MNSFSLTAAAAVSLGLLCSPASAGGGLTDIGVSFDNSISFPPRSTPIIGDSVTHYFEFELPAAEFVSASMSISGSAANPVGAAPVPEISTWAMIAVGFACVAFLSWRFQD
jgi:hypothetical protein